MVTLQVHIDDNMKTAADSLFSSLGLDTSTAVRMFISSALENHGLPFLTRQRETNPEVVRPIFGSGRGKMWIADDFNWHDDNNH